MRGDEHIIVRTVSIQQSMEGLNKARQNRIGYERIKQSRIGQVG